jgi:protein TonB
LCTLPITGGDYLAQQNLLIDRGGNVSFVTILKKVGRVFLCALMLTGLLAVFPPVTGQAQESLERKVKSKVEPAYPEIARRMGLTGTVKLQVVVAANGAVKETHPLGGHPILINAAMDAVKKWRFESASTESTGTVEFRFEPGS